MSEAAQLAKTAREHLAAALNALQSNAHVPDALMDLAEPIAEAMSVLHRIERTDGANLAGREGALANVRTALNQLQAISVHHPAIDVVMESVASSLSKVHALTRITPAGANTGAAPAPAPRPASVPPAPRVAPQYAQTEPVPRQMPSSLPPAPQAAPAMVPQMSHRGGTQPMSAPQQAAPAPQQMAAQGAAHQLPDGGLGFTQAMPQASPFANMPSRNVPQPAPAYAQQPQAAFPAPTGFAAQPTAQAPMAQPQPMQAAPVAQQVAPMQPQQHGPPMQQHAQPMQQHAPPMQPHAAPVMQPQAQQAPMQPQPQPSKSAPGGGLKVDVELGVHSPSNFYKGLGGNDVIEHGGIFVATYKIPKLGSQVILRVLLPGDYEFQASAVVQWTREGGVGDSAEPGFGARFTQISPEARQLVYRYTRNREPIFYDDL